LQVKLLLLMMCIKMKISTLFENKLKRKRLNLGKIIYLVIIRGRFHKIHPV